ncbi:MAG: extracellular solute-binding protein, partial [Spirochaetota bacterium]
IITWEGYLPESLINEFEEKYGYEVKLTFISGNGELISKLKASDAKGFDLAQNDIGNIPEAMADNLYQPIDLSKLKNYKYINPPMKERAEKIATIDGKLYGVPFCWGTSGLMANVEKAPGVNSYMDLFSDKYCGKVTYRATRNTMIAAALAMGIDSVEDKSMWESEEETRRVWEKVTEFLIDAKKCVKTYWTSKQQMIDLFLTGGVVVGMGWDFTAWSLAEQGHPIKFITPKEGCLAWEGGWEIPRNAANLDAAYKFMDWFWKPERSAKLFSEAGVMPVVKGWEQYASEEDRKKFQETYSQEAIENFWWYPPYPKWWVTVTAEYETQIKTALSE